LAVENFHEFDVAVDRSSDRTKCGWYARRQWDTYDSTVLRLGVNFMSKRKSKLRMTVGEQLDLLVRVASKRSQAAYEC